MIRKQKIIIFDFEKQYPCIDNPLEALVESLVQTQDYTCCVYTINDSTMEFSKEQDVECIKIKESSLKSIFNTLSFIKIVRNRNNIVHAFGTQAVEILVPLNYRFGKCRFVGTFTYLPKIISVAKLQKQYQKVHSITTPTRHCGNTMIHILHLRQNQISIIPIGVTKSFYLMQKRQEGKRAIFTVVAPLEPGNSLLEILDSLSILHKANILSDWEVRFIGEGSLFSTIIEHATNIGIVDRIALLGEYPLVDILQSTRVLIIPSFFWYASQAIYAGVLMNIPIIHTKDANILDSINFNHQDITSFASGDSVEIRSAIKQALEMKTALDIPVYSLEQTIHAFHAVYRRIT